MGTYKEIQNYVQEEHGFNVKTCWIAHVKEKNGLADKNTDRQNPCPNDKVAAIQEALHQLGDI